MFSEEVKQTIACVQRTGEFSVPIEGNSREFDVLLVKGREWPFPRRCFRMVDLDEIEGNDKHMWG